MNIDPITFLVRGQAQPKGSTKAFLHNKSGAIITHASNRGRLRDWENCVRTAALRVRRRDRFYGAVRLNVTFFLVRPKSAPPAKRPHPHVKPDLSKLLRGIEDAMTGVLYNDDAQIVAVEMSKTYCGPGDAGAVITLIPLEGR